MNVERHSLDVFGGGELDGRIIGCAKAAELRVHCNPSGSRRLVPSRTVKKTRRIRCPCAMCKALLNKDHFSPMIRRIPLPTTPNQNRSCKTTLSIPNTMISSHRPELTQNHIVSPDPSIRLSTLSAKITKHTSAASW